MSASSVDLLEVTPRQAVEQLESDLGLSVRELASGLGVDPRTVERWRAGTTYPQHEARRRLAELLAVQRRLHDTFTTVEAIRGWMHSPHPLFGRLTAADMVRLGRFERVDGALEALDSGIFI